MVMRAKSTCFAVRLRAVGRCHHRWSACACRCVCGDCFILIGQVSYFVVVPTIFVSSLVSVVRSFVSVPPVDVDDVVDSNVPLQ